MLTFQDLTPCAQRNIIGNPMRKTVHFCSTKFTPQIICNAFEIIRKILTMEEKEKISSRYNVKNDHETWHHDNDSEFFADYIKDCSWAHYRKDNVLAGFDLEITFNGKCSDIAVKAPTRSIIEEIHQIFIQNEKACLLPPEKRKGNKEHIVFIGHGKNPQWRELKDHLQDKHEYAIEAYEVGARAGHTIRDILDEMLEKSSIAFLVMTAEDEDSSGKMHARENVIHELGLFQGKLGFSRAIALLEETTNEFSNIHGIQQIRFSRGNIKESFGDVVATIKREFSK
jgi:predicted nucleotide-binding protein